MHVGIIVSIIALVAIVIIVLVYMLRGSNTVVQRPLAGPTYVAPAPAAPTAAYAAQASTAPAPAPASPTPAPATQAARPVVTTEPSQTIVISAAAPPPTAAVPGLPVGYSNGEIVSDRNSNMYILADNKVSPLSLSAWVRLGSQQPRHRLENLPVSIPAGPAIMY